MRRFEAQAKDSLHDEQGTAIITVIAMVTVALALGGVATVTATNTLRGTSRDESSKDALAAAEAGAQIALQRQNQVAVDHDPLAESCVDLAALDRKGPVGSGGWCPATTGSVGDAEYGYRVSPPSDPAGTGLVSAVEIVSVGTSDGITRRLHVTAESPAATAIFAQSSVIGDTSITLDGNAEVFAHAATNGSITLNNQSVLCGVAQTGDGAPPVTNENSEHGGVPPCDQATYSAGSGTVNLPPIDQGDVADPDMNSNFRIASGEDTISGQVAWDAGARTLTLDSNSAITLGGQDYSFCRLHLKSNTELIVAAGANVRIFFDSPENCQPQLGEGPQILLESNSKLTTTDGSPASLQLLVVGSSDPNVTSDNVLLVSNSKTSMPVILYAPNSEIGLASNANLLGALAGKSVTLAAESSASSHPDAADLQLPLPLQYRQTQFVECSSTEAPTDAPSSNC